MGWQAEGSSSTLYPERKGTPTALTVSRDGGAMTAPRACCCTLSATRVGGTSICCFSQGRLARLHQWRQAGRRQSVMYRDGWLFQGERAMRPMSMRLLCHISLEVATPPTSLSRSGRTRSVPASSPTVGGRDRYPGHPRLRGQPAGDGGAR